MSNELRTFASITLAAGLASSGFGTLPAQAQENAGEDASVLEEVVVMARRREESLQDTPVSITAFTGDALERQHVDRLSGIGPATPNLTFDTGATFSGANSSASVFIRGIGQVDFTLTTEPGVGIYLDGVYMSHTIGSVLDLVDIDHVEVLRGPQGTLFGRNTIGGAINVISRKPDETLNGSVQVTGGSYDRFDLRGSVNVPLTETLFMRASAATYNRDGYVDAPNTPDQDDLGNVNQDAGRLAFRWVPNDQFTADLTVDVSSSDESGTPTVLVQTYEGASLALIGSLADPTSPNYVPPPFPLPAPSFVDLYNILATVPLGEQGCLPPPIAPPFCPPTVVPNPLFGGPTFGQGNVIDIHNDNWVNYSTMDLASETDTWGAGLTLEYDFDVATLKSITSFRHMEARTGFDTDATAILIGDLVDTFDLDTFAQELQLSGVAFDDRLDWLVGVYYSNEDGINLDDVEFTPVRILSGADIDNDSTAGFMQFTFDATDRLALTAGVRYTDESKRFSVPGDCFRMPKGPETLFDGTVVTCTQMQTVVDPKYVNEGFLTFVNAPVFPDQPDPNARICCLPISDAEGNIVGLIRGLVPGYPTVPPGTTLKRAFDDWTPHLNAAYRWNDELMTYLSYSEGFKSGGFVQRVFPPKTEVPSFEPETAKVYELGFKWLGLDARLMLNGAIFHTDYEDLQIEVNDGIAPVTRNAAQADIEGFELEMTALPGEGWMIQAGIGYLDAEYTELDPSENFTTDLISLTLDSQLVNTPEWSTNLGVQYEFSLGNGGQLVSRVDWYYKDDHYKDALNFPELRQEAFSLVDVYVTYVAASGSWEASLFGKNITDETYIVSGFSNGLTQGRATANLGRPDEWGVSFKYLFGE